jgi:hypothetical protein
MLSRAVAFFKRHNSVEEIVADFHWMIGKLEALIESKLDAAEAKLVAAAQLKTDAEIAKAEAIRAGEVVDKLKTIVS